MSFVFYKYQNSHILNPAIDLNFYELTKYTIISYNSTDSIKALYTQFGQSVGYAYQIYNFQKNICRGNEDNMKLQFFVYSGSSMIMISSIFSFALI